MSPLGLRTRASRVHVFGFDRRGGGTTWLDVCVGLPFCWGFFVFPVFIEVKNVAFGGGCCARVCDYFRCWVLALGGFV